MTKRIVSWLLVLALLVSGIPMAHAQETSTQVDGSVTVTADNSLAELLSAEIAGEMAVQQGNTGYNVFSIEVEDAVATVRLEAKDRCVLVVGIYDESGTALLASGQTAVDSGDEMASVTIETAQMPQYFIAKAYLVGEVEMNPLCTAYVTPNYTQEMQEFFAKTAEDFDSDLVVHLDESNDGNFLVYNEGVIQVSETETANRLTSRDDTYKYYSFSDCDDTMKALKDGDILAYTTLSGELLIIRVKGTPYVSGNYVSLDGYKTTVEEVFAYVRVDAAAGVEEDGYDESTCDSGVEFVGFEETAGPNATTVGGKTGVSVELNLGDASTDPGKLTGKISGTLTLHLDATFSLYITENYRSLTLLLNYGAKVNVEMSVKAELLQIKLGTFTICPVYGMFITMTPALEVEASAKLSVEGDLKGTIGFTTNTQTGMKDLSSSPKMDAKIEGKFTVFVGLSLEPEVVVVSDYLASVGIKGKAGVELSAKFCSTQTVDGIRHECQRCLDGDVHVKVSVSFEASFLSNPNWTYKLELLELKWKKGDFYLSLDRGEFGFSTCPYLLYRVNIRALDRSGNPAGVTEVTFTGNGREFVETTWDNGTYEAYLPGGTYTVTAEDYNRYSKPWTVVVDKDTEELVIRLEYDFFDPEVAYQVAAVERGSTTAAAITVNGDLYVWGDNGAGQVGAGSEEAYIKSPVKVLENVAKVSLGKSHSAALTKDGDLYVWGSSYVMDDSGYYVVSNSPVQVMSGVKDVAAGKSNTAVVMENGDLYLWGNGRVSGEYLNSSGDENGLMLQNIRSVETTSDVVLAVSEDDELYAWGNNSTGMLADGTLTDSVVPRKVMDNVSFAGFSRGAAAVTNDGKLYTWGHLIDLTLIYSSNPDDNVTSPELRMTDVVQFSGGDGYTAVFLTSDGLLYAWGTSTLGVTDKSDKYGNPIISIPLPVLSGVKDVALCAASYTVLLETGEMQVWGNNNYYQLGIGDQRETVETPTTVVLGPTEDNGANGVSDLAPMTIPGKAEVTGEGHTAIFENLAPGAMYQFYVMEDRDSQMPFAPENLLYIDQVIAGADGIVEITYQPTRSVSYADVFLEEYLAPALVTERVNPFNDVPESEFYYEPVLWAVEEGITSGMTPTTFEPGTTCTRAQVVTFLWRAAGKPEPKSTEHPFKDVTEDYYYKAMLWAVEEGITNGMSAETFAPGATCTRGQVVTFLWRAAGKPAPEKTEHPFEDVTKDYYYDAMLWAVENGITNGMSPTTFEPGRTCTRAQVVTFLYRAFAE